MNHRQAVSYHGHTIQYRRVEHFSMDVFMFIEILSLNICPIKSYPVKA